MPELPLDAALPQAARPEACSGLPALLAQGERELAASLAQLAGGSDPGPAAGSVAAARAAASRLGMALADRPPGAPGLDPLIWLAYYRLGQVVLGDHPLPPPWAPQPERLDQLVRRCLPQGQVVAWGDPSVYSPPEWGAILDLLQEGGDFVPDLAAPCTGSQAALQQATATVLAMVRRLPAGLGPAIDALLRLTILAVPGPQAQAAGAGFGGATAFFLRGASVIHASPGLTLPGLLERLVHEAAHAELFVLAQDGPLCNNPDDERHPVRIRPDPRPMNGILHSLNVTGRVCETLDALLAAPSLAETLAGTPREQALLLEDCRRLRAHQQALGHSSLEAVRRHGRLTALGAAVCDAGARRLKGAASADGTRPWAPGHGR